MSPDINKFISEGYVQSAAEFQVSRHQARMLADFRAKTAILRGSFADREQSAYSFIDYVFGDVDELMVITSGEHEDDEKGTFSAMAVDDLVEYQATRSDVFVSPASFFNRKYALVTCSYIYAYVIDIDDITPHILRHIIGEGCYGASAIVNSGQGCHLYYVFEKPVPYFYRNRSSLQEIYKKIFGYIQHNLAAHVDPHSLIQPFRLVGSQSKLEEQTVGFVCGDKWDIFKLGDFVGVEFEGSLVEKYQLEELPPRKYNEQKAENQKKLIGRKCPFCKRGDLILRTSAKGEFIGCTGFPKCNYMEDMEGNVLRKRNDRKSPAGLYEYCYQRVWNETAEGNRYMSMVALVTVAVKSDIDRERLEKDLIDLVDEYNRKGSLVKYKEIDKALRVYNEKARKTRSDVLETWFGWKFPRSGYIRKKEYDEDWQGVLKDFEESEKFREEARNAGLLNEDGTLNRQRYHLYEARAARDKHQDRLGRSWTDNSSKRSRKEDVLKWKKEHPGASKNACAKATGMSYHTVMKWWDEQ